MKLCPTGEHGVTIFTYTEYGDDLSALILDFLKRYS